MKSRPEMPIGKENVGFRLLKQMGWREGQGLGKCGCKCLSINDSVIAIIFVLLDNAVASFMHFTSCLVLTS